MGKNNIDLNKPFTARWVFAYDSEGDRTACDVFTGGDEYVENWKQLVNLGVMYCDNRGVNIRSIEFQTYNLDENGECIDGTIMDYMIDWVEGQARLACIIDNE